ncbi:MAG: ATP-grasp domain-containing protein, partial [Verrucomicrobiota bacterium]
MNTSTPILPGSVIGVVGGGQLGRMFVQAAHRMGYRVHIFTPESFSPAGQVADWTVHGDYNDREAMQRFAREVDVMTFEFENIPAESIEAISSLTRVRPGSNILRVAQNRNTEKSTLHIAGFPVAPFEAVRTPSDLERAVDKIGAPAVLKAATNGYDGKGQVALHAPEQAMEAWSRIGACEQTLERMINFDLE